MTRDPYTRRSKPAPLPEPDETTLPIGDTEEMDKAVEKVKSKKAAKKDANKK